MRLTHDDEQAIKDLLIGRTITKVDGETLRLDDGTLLNFQGNWGCGGCTAGNYYLTELNDCPNMIMNVTFDDEDLTSGDEPDVAYRIFVYAENQMIKLAEFEGTDGNGYYGTGYWIDVTPTSPAE